jgi:hypothetical protein
MLLSLFNLITKSYNFIALGVDRKGYICIHAHGGNTLVLYFCVWGYYEFFSPT